MPTGYPTLGATFVAVASGPGEAFVTFMDDDGFWATHSSTNPAGITTAHPRRRGDSFFVQIPTGEHLHLRGRGRASVSATTLV